MNGRVDLDALTPGFWQAGDPERYRALITELRAARVVTDTLRIYDDGPMELPAPLAAVLAAYDKAAGS